LRRARRLSQNSFFWASVPKNKDMSRVSALTAAIVAVVNAKVAVKKSRVE
jgi:hypothetical protein